MASNRRRRTRSIGKMVSSTDRRLRFLQRKSAPRRIGARVIKSSDLRRNIITTPAIDDDAITTQKLEDDAITTQKLDDNAVDNRVLGPDAVDSDNLSEGAVDRVALDSGVIDEIETAQGTADAAQGAADTAQGAADTAQVTADGKNKVYRQNEQPTGTHAVGDLWFDTNDDNKHYRWSGSSWVGFTLGDGALASISANKLTAGTIDASVITVSNLDAGNITTGGINASLITVTNINANNITTGFINADRIEAGSIVANKIETIDGGQISGGTIRAGVSFVIGGGAGITSENGRFVVGPDGAVSLNSIVTSSGNIAVNCGGAILNVINSSGSINGQVATTPYTDGRYRRLGVTITGTDIAGSTITGANILDGTVRATDCDIGTGSGQIARGSHIHDVQGSSGVRSQSFSGNAQTLSHSHDSGNYTAAISTRRLKKEITPYKFDTSKLLDLQLVKFKYKNQVKEYQHNKEWAYGYIAEDLIKIGLEEVVGYAADGRIANVNYGVLSTLILELVKEHDAEIQKIKKDLTKIAKTRETK